jgi:predicted O-methyltransferase YrrM
LDAAAIYTGIPAFKPKRVVEVGSGNSTVFMARAVADHRLPTEITCIDPQPRIDISALNVKFERRTLSLDDVELFAGFDPGDILFIDSSHIMQQDFDVDILFNRIFPVLKPGVIVHVHDIFLPYGYPKSWRPYRFNEQNALVGWLVSGFFDVVFPCQYVFRDMGSELQQRMTKFPEIASRNGGSMWMRRSGTAA